MTHIPLTDAAGKFIDKWDAWTRPRSDYQWKRGRSAMELARAWFRSPKSCCPDEVTALLESHPALRGSVFKRGRPELVTPLPERGEGRNHDLWLTGATASQKVTVCIEAKADEAFGERLGRQIQTARKRQPRTRAAERARALLTILFGQDGNPEGAPWRDLRYQLITAAAGTLLQAQVDQSTAAVLVVHEFRSDQSIAESLATNQADLDAFAEQLHPGVGNVAPGQLIGPIAIPPSPLLPDGMSFFLGKAVVDIGIVATTPSS